MDVTVRTDDAALGDLAAEWNTLLDSDPSASAFHTPEYAAAAWETELGADRAFAAIEMRREGELVGLATVTIDPDGTLRFLGNAAVSDYLGPISAPQDRDEVAVGFVEGISRLEWKTGDLLGLAGDSAWPEALSRAAKAADLRVTEAQQDVCPRVALTGDFDSYLASISSKLRHEIRRKARRLEREAGPYSIRLSTEETLDRDLERFYDLHRSSRGPKGRFMHEEVAVLFTRIARAFQAKGWLRMSWLEIDGNAIAGTFSFRARDVWEVYNSAYDHELSHLAPGMVLMAETIRLATEERCRVFDLLRGGEPYKYRFGAIDMPLMRLTLEH
jgi:CelD/BcsL family acetyltransferase involved in cellulose biosynthesis